MADTRDGVELIIGVQQDPTLGPVALVGLGGLHAEVFKDVQLRLAPVDPAEARRAIEALSAFPILAGARGRPPVDVDSAAACLSDLSALASRHPEIAAIEVNPLLVTPTGAVALDARVILANKTEATNHQEQG
jgi:acyl-CoA synthetase (NDP forming)